MFDIFIKRPVLASVISLLILFVGLRALMMLPLRQYPEVTNTVITVTTVFPGADADLIQGFVTQPLQQAIATAEGLDYISSRSLAGMSEIKAYVRLNTDPNVAMTEVMSKVSEVRSLLPRGINDPVSKKATGQTFASAYLAFSSDQLSQQQITDYVSRVVQPKLSAIPGVANPELLGGQKFSMRIWLDPEKMAQFDLSPNDIRSALTRNSYTAAAGSTKGTFDVISTRVDTDLKTVDEFKQLAIRNVGTRVVRIDDVATVALGPENDDSSVFAAGKPAVFMGIHTTPDANPLTVVKQMREVTLPEIRTQLPAGLTAKIAYDSTIFIGAAISEVAKTLLEASVVVMVVIYLFMGSLRSVIIPVLTVPLSLVGVSIFLLALGFSINLLTLLAMVLAIGLVVDDAIVVVENIHRHIEEGLSPFHAALVGTREIAGPVISMTITLAAVYAPIAFMGGLTGALFKEFALTLAGAVIISGFVALTLSPMLSSKLLRHEGDKKGIAARIDRVFGWIRRRYERSLTAGLQDRTATVLFALVVMASLPFLFKVIPTELAPQEDQGVMFVAFDGPSSANADFMRIFTHEIDQKLRNGFPEIADTFLIAGMGAPNKGFGGAVLTPWGERPRSTKILQPELLNVVGEVSGVKPNVFQPAPLPGVDGLPVQFVISSIADYRQLEELQAEIVKRASMTGLFPYIDADLKYESPSTRILIDRDKAAAYGVAMQDIGDALGLMTGGNYVNLVNLQGRSYQVIPQVPREYRLDPDQLGRFHVQTKLGKAIPLSSLVSFDHSVDPVSLNQFNQLNSVTIQAFPMPGTTLGQALATLEGIAKEVLPPQGYTYDFAGQSRQYVQEGNALVMTFVFALIIIFLVLAAWFESFRDPLVIMISVPLSICGALIPLAVGVATMNIYTQVGLVTLIGLITKHGILICEVAREQQEQHGLSRAQAVKVAASLRLRPILMTTAAMVSGLFPLLLASGAGAASRFSIAVVIVSGMSIGTLFTLFVLPVVYTFLASKRTLKKKDEDIKVAYTPSPANVH